MSTDRQRLTRRIHAEAHRLGFTEEGRIALQVRVTGRRSLATMSAQQLQAVLAALADPEALASEGPREPVSTQKAETYLRAAFDRAGRPDLAPGHDEIELWAHTPWRRNHGKAVAREALPVAVRGDRKSAPRWDPDELDRYVRRALERAGAGA
ncbi:MAG: hypothetical protein F4Y03_09430 [Alphaproteobacteria bacterium]|nr:hypothetical protein [Alphaproteobacteria bacterium]